MLQYISDGLVKSQHLHLSLFVWPEKRVQSPFTACPKTTSADGNASCILLLCSSNDSGKLASGSNPNMQSAVTV